MGRRLGWEVVTGGSVDPGPACLIGPAGDLVAVAERRPDGLVRTLRVFVSRADQAAQPGLKEDRKSEASPPSYVDETAIV